MTDYDDIHICSYYCKRPECVKAQRDELRELYFAALERIKELEQSFAKTVAATGWEMENGWPSKIIDNSTAPIGPTTVTWELEQGAQDRRRECVGGN